MMITTLLTLIKLKLKTHLAEISLHSHESHEKSSLDYLAIENQKRRSIFYKLRDSIHRHLGTFMICIDIFKRFQIVIVDGIFNILKNMFQ